MDSAGLGSQMGYQDSHEGNLRVEMCSGFPRVMGQLRAA